VIFYGKRATQEESCALIEAFQSRLHAVSAMQPGLDRHTALVAALLAAGELAQGVADADFERFGADREGGPHRNLLAFATDLARAVIRSWDSGFAAIPVLPRLVSPADLPGRVSVRTIEGFAYYSVYPEAYIIAARRLRLGGAARVIGIRSIGTTLAPVVAAALGAPVPLTLRPLGDAFDRRLSLSADTLAALIDPRSHYVLVDEGPGLSGSSLGAAARLLIGNGVDRERIAFLPSHGSGPGPRAGAAARSLWRSVQTVPATPDVMRLRQRLAEWIEPHVGRLTAPLEDLSAGAWRRHVYGDRRDWPAVDPKHERMKFLAVSETGKWTIKFAALGGEGERKLKRARLLERHRLVPPAKALVHGFLVQRWVEGRPLGAADPPPIEAIARYLRGRAAALPAPQRRGASLGQLAEMARANVLEGLGTDAACRLAARFRGIEALEERAIPVAIDGKLDRCEWIRDGAGRLWKVDALDHDAGHDLIGPQDMAWDVAGAAVEWELNDAGLARLLGVMERAGGAPIDGGLLDFFLLCYPAFRLGAATLAESVQADDRDRALNRARISALALRLSRTLVR
jgi:hypothetical protein